MKILAIDTSSSNCSVSILEDSNLQKEKHFLGQITHSEKLMPMIDDLLTECSLTLSDINLLACSNGPGSFTGVRIGVSTIKAFADVTGIPIVPVSSLRGLAYNVLNSYLEKKSELVCSLIDAKNDYVYCGLFKRKKDDTFNAEGDYLAKNIHSIIEEINKTYNEPIIFVGDGAIAHKYYILQEYPKAIFAVKDEMNIQNSVSIGIGGYHKYLEGIYGDSNFLTPLYLRKSQAERALEGEK